MKRAAVILISLGAMLLKSEALDYRASYFFQGDVKGIFLFVIPFRVFFETAASVDFVAHRDESNRYEFCFREVPRPGYLFRSTGFKGKQFVFLAAGSEPEQTLVFSIDKMRELMENNPGYAKYMINTRKVLVRIPPDQEGSMGFIRSRFGRHGDFLYDFQVHTADRSGKNQIFFNIYPILMEFLKVFNHSCVPVSSLSELDSRTFWQGPPLDLTRILNGIGRNAAQIVKQFIVFRQGHSFRLNYQVTSLNETEIELCGEAHPEVKIWKGFRIMDVTRRIRFRAADSILIFDQFSIEVRNSRNFGGLARVMLKLIE